MYAIPTPARGYIPQFLASVLGLGIILLAAANGFFTYSGALLYIDEYEYALLFAGAVQFAIAMTLLALPFVKGLGKPILILVYTCALGLSTLSAYTYIYNASLPGDFNSPQLDTQRQANLATALTRSLQSEKQELDDRYQQKEQLRRTTEEEATLGLNSGMGPGKGREYYRKLEEYESLHTRYELDAQRINSAEQAFIEFNGLLKGSPEALTPEAILASLTVFRSHLKGTAANAILDSAVQENLGQQPTPIERAIGSLKVFNQYDTQTLVSIVWASVFDLLALFLGIIRYHLLFVSKPLLTRLYDGALEVSTFTRRLRHLREDSKARYRSQLNVNTLPLNSLEMQNFATHLLAGSQLSMDENSPDSSEPIRRIIQYFEPLYSEKTSHMVGIPWDTIGSDARLAPLVSMLVQNQVLLNDNRHEAYVLNAAVDAAQKVLVLMRLGMKEAPESMAGVDFLLGEQTASLVASRA